MNGHPVAYSRSVITELMVPSYANFGGKVHGGTACGGGAPPQAFAPPLARFSVARMRFLPTPEPSQPSSPRIPPAFPVDAAAVPSAAGSGRCALGGCTLGRCTLCRWLWLLCARPL